MIFDDVGYPLEDIERVKGALDNGISIKFLLG